MRSRFPHLPALCLVAGFALLYVLTAQRGISWGDSGLFQLRALSGDVRGSAGLALSHPLYVLVSMVVCRIVPETFRFWAMNATSGMFGALSVGGMFMCARLLTGSRKAAFLAALAFGCSHMAWWLSTMSEVYTMSAMFLSGELFFMMLAIRSHRPGFAVSAFMMNGLHFSVHGFALLSLPVLVLAFGWLLVRERGDAIRRLGMCLAALAVWIAGAFAILSLAWRMAFDSGSVAEALRSLLVGGYGAAVVGVSCVSWRLTCFNLALSALSFAVPCVFALAAFAIRRRIGPCGEVYMPEVRPMRMFVVAMLCVHALFWVRYRVADQMTFLLPTLFLAILSASPSFAVLRRPFACAAFAVTASVALPLAAAMSAQPFAAAMSAGRPSLPFREDLRYFTLPWKHNENSAERFVRAAAEVLPPDAFVYADITAYAPLACARRCGIISEGVALYGDVWGKCGGSSCWEVRPFPPYRLSPREATLEKRGVMYKVVMP